MTCENTIFPVYMQPSFQKVTETGYNRVQVDAGHLSLYGPFNKQVARFSYSNVGTAVIQHMLEAISTIGGYLSDMNESDFQNSGLHQDGVIRQIQIIGEAAKRVSPDVTSEYPDIPWRDIAGMRDKLVHDYFGVDVGLVWVTATQDIPALEAQLKEVLENL